MQRHQAGGLLHSPGLQVLRSEILRDPPHRALQVRLKTRPPRRTQEDALLRPPQSVHGRGHQKGSARRISRAKRFVARLLQLSPQEVPIHHESELLPVRRSDQPALHLHESLPHRHALGPVRQRQVDRQRR